VERETAGSLSIKAALDKTNYNAEELGNEIVTDVAREIEICASKHSDLFADDLEEFFVCYLIAGDPLIKNLMRIKYYALPWLPKPRADQGCFLYNKALDKYTHLWSLPNALTMQELHSLDIVHQKFLRMKFWCDCFFNGNFWEEIRKENGIDHLAEEEIVKRNNPKGKEPQKECVIEDIEKYFSKGEEANV